MKNNSRLYSWALYDFANTVFSAVVLTFYFPLYLTGIAGENVPLGISTTAAMVLAGLWVPWLGALSDRTGKTKQYLIYTTLLSIFFTFSLSFFSEALPLMIAFLLACFFFHASLVFYSSLLPVIARPEEQGRASGFGTALGYLGVLFSMPLAHFVDGIFGRRFVFIVAGFCFLIFALPLFFRVPERKIENPVRPSFRLFIEESVKVFHTVKSLGKKPPLLLFFLGNFLVVEAMNTMIFWFAVYVTQVFGLPQNQLLLLFLALNFGAFLSGLVAGFLTDRWGSQKIILLSAFSLFVSLSILSLTRNFWIFALVSLTGGAFGLAGMWTAARKRVVELAPKEAVGEYFGLYNLTTKISVMGSLIFSVLADRLGFQAALLSQVIPSGAGLLLLWLAKEVSRRNASRYPSS